MGALRQLWSHFAAHAEYLRNLPKAVGIVGAIAFPLFLALHELRGTKDYDSAWLRGTAALLCLGLALRDHWPARFKQWYVPWSYVTFLFCLPFFNIFLALKNGGGSVAVANTFMAVFFLVLLADWRNTVVMLVAGAGAATLAYIATTPQPAMPVDYLGRLPTLILVVIGGNAFKLSEKLIQSERLAAATALAGSIAHEMRNPLGQLRHSLAGIQRALPSPGASGQLTSLLPAEVETLYRHLGQGEQAIQRGLQVISMTLDELGARPPDPASFACLSAAEVVHKAVEEYGYDSDEARARVDVHVQDDFQFRGEETAFLFVLFNLIKNALYYPSSQVTLTVGGQRVSVRDTGPGIPPEALAGLFEPFRTAGKVGGTGLGLAYCSRVLTAFGGEIRCSSVAGQPTEFTLSLPPVDAQEQERFRMAVLEAARERLGGRRLLMVEGDAAQRLTTRHKLRPLNLQVDEAPDGERALELLSSHVYDLVLLDLDVPVLDGYQLAQRLRQGQVPANRYVCMVAHTSDPAQLARIKTQRAGMDGFINKPSAQLPLIQALQRAFERRATAGRVLGGALAGRRLLLADDSPYSRRAVAAYLREAGVTVVEAEHGVEVLQQLGSGGAFDAVLMDLDMPALDGLEAARAIRESGQQWASVPIVALTAHSDAPAMASARAAGMSAFLVKPVDAADLYATVESLLTGARQPFAAASRDMVAPGAADPPLLNVARLQSYQRLGLLDELIANYLPEIGHLVEVLGQAVRAGNLDSAQEALHSLLGMSGEAGALALYQMVRGVYVPVLEERRWPQAPDWLARIQQLAAETERALREYGARHASPTA